MSRPRALVIGGGIAGPVTAIFLKKAGIDAELFEAWPHSTGIGGGLQIARNRPRRGHRPLEQEQHEQHEQADDADERHRRRPATAGPAGLLLALVARLGGLIHG